MIDLTAFEGHTPGPWFVSGVRVKMNGGHWHSVNRYDEAAKKYEGIACVGFDPRSGVGLVDARLIASAPDLLAEVVRLREALMIADLRLSHLGDNATHPARAIVRAALET